MSATLLIFVEDGTALWWSEEELYEYIKSHKDDDPLSILNKSPNKYAIGRAKVWGSDKERREKLGREV